MIRIYYYLVLLNAAVGLAVGIIATVRNRFQLVGPLFGTAIGSVAIWLFGFAHYFDSLPPDKALWWAKFTLTFAIINHSFVLHSFCQLVEKARKYQWWIATSYVCGLFFVILLWKGLLVTGLKPSPYMDHYVSYNRTWYPALGLHLVVWEWLAIWVLLSSARKATGYQYTQLVYFIIVWLIIFISTTSIIIPLEYDIAIQPFGFFINPVNFAFLAYVMATARLADINVVVARMMVYAIMLAVVAVVSLLFIGAVSLLAPGFMNQAQVLFTVALVVVIGLSLTALLPRFLPRVERMMQERLFGGRFGYQDVLSQSINEIGRSGTMEQMLETVATTLHSNMQVSHVLILLQDPLSDEYRLEAQCGLKSDVSTDKLTLSERSLSVRWLGEHKDALVREEAMRHLPASMWKVLSAELDQLQAAVCIPMLLEERVVGVIALGEKLNREMYFVSDLRLLSTLATEAAIGVRYRRLEEQAVRNNKLIELGTIAAGIAHEIRNPLASIRTFAQLLPTKMDDPEFKNEFSKLVVQDVERITRVIQSMLSFARPGTVNIGSHSATDLVEEALTLVVARLRGKHIEIIRNFHENPVLRVDRQQILQVLLNLLSNAADALQEQGHVRITVGVQRVERTIGMPGQRFGVIEIADNGPGIPTAIRNRLFVPFFTTKKEGNGLGLSISEKIVRDHNGFITVSSIEGRGAAFQVQLPMD